MHQKKVVVVVVVVYRTNLLTGHFKVYRMDEEEVVRGVEAGAGVDMGEERATIFSLKSKKLYIGIIAASGSSRVKTLKRSPRVIHPTVEIKPHQNVLVSNLKK
ncbi:hypothetical protein HYC85_018564 [Camellia sinensis]|uniref:Uncharacterized protein n=1 Tax=Camellia sinensis TaxID=4442 RepID=A0A7J7GVL6_CAMSI|nr:hypothetical protein HYC85_018564 [Camellia sinensis]